MSSSPSSPSRLRLWLVALLVFAAAVRLVGLDFDDKHFFHPDERRIAFAVGELSFQPLQLNPHFFAYGSFPFYVNRAVSSLLSNIDPRMANYDGVMMTGRAVSGVIGTLTVLLLTVLGARLYNRSVGLLAGFLLAACVLHVQNSHYGTTDIFLTFLVTLALYCMIGIVQRGWTRDYVYAGLAIGFAAATKFSALPLLAPLAVAGLVRIPRDGFLRVAGRGLLAVVCLAAAFAAGQPYAILDFANYARDITEQSGMVREAGRLPYTNQYIGVVKYYYDLTQMFWWGMTPPLAIAAIWATAARVVGAVRERSATDAVLLAWVLPFFLITGSFDVKFVRYLLPIYPIMILWAAAFLWRAAQRSLLGRIAMWGVAIATGLAALAFLSIYTRPHTVVTASEWLYRNVPPGKVIVTQHWDEGFPLPLPGQNPGKYKVDDLPYYEPDTPGKWRDIANRLAAADYIAFQTKRLYGALTMAPQKYPIANNYFYQLFAGDLGFTLVYDHASRPELLGLEAPDELADESITVYDHPKVLIFENTGRLSADELYEKIMHGMPSKKLTRTDLLLAEANRVGGTSEPASPIRASVPALLWFALIVELLGVAGFAILRRALPVPGVYGLAKVFGILLFAYIPWLLVSTGQAAFTRGTLAATLGGLLLWGALAWRRGRGDEPSGEWAPTELLFWGSFLLFLLVRAFNPEIFWGEKPMDFSFLNALMRTTTLPPPEPWFSGSTLHYTYFGHYVVAALGKVGNIHPGLVFNLGIALFGALTASAAFALGGAIGGRRGIGLLCAVFVVLIGNLAGLREVLARHVINFDYWWATSRVIKDTINEYPFWSFLFADLHAHVLVMPFSLSFLALAVWWVRRSDAPAVISPLATVVLLGFLLGAIMVTNGWSSPTYILFFPFLLGCTALAQSSFGRGRVALLGVLGLVAAGLVAAKLAMPQPPPWLIEQVGDPLAARLLPAALAGAAGLFVLVLLPAPTILTGLLVGLAYLLFLPFWRDFSPPPRNFGLEDQSFANAWDFANIFGLFLFIAIPFVFALWRRALRPVEQPLGFGRRLAMWLVALTVLACWLASVPAVAHLLPFGLRGSLRLGLAILAVLSFSVAIQRGLTSTQRVAVSMLAFAFAITAGTDMVFVWDRMNTIFKFYLEAWFLFAAGSAAATAELWRGLIRRPALRRAWQLGLVVLLALATFTAVSGIWAVVRTDRVPTPEPTLDGTAYLAEQAPLERAAYEWLNDNVAGIPVVAEAYGPSYQDYARVAMNTGLPIVLGWDYHVSQRAQRWPDINKRKDDLKRLYTTDSKQVAAEILRKYHIALVYVGGVERRAYSGGNLKRFQEWNDLLKPIYTNPGVTVFAVEGQYAGAIPVNAIQEVPPVPEGEEVKVQGAPGQLSQPRGLALDGAGNVYVADFGNDRIQKFDPDFGFVKEWGSHGDLPAQFKQPGDVAVGPDGSVYVADTWNQRVQVFSPDGEYLREWTDKYYGPRGIAVGPNGAVYLADTGNHKVRRFTPDGVEDRAWGSLGKEQGQFTEPVGLAVDKTGKVYVVDNGNARLQIFDRDGALIGAFPVDGWEQKVFSEPHVAVAPDGTIWVTVPTRQLIRAYHAKGGVVKEIQGGDDPALPFDRPMGIAYDPRTDTLVISDLENRLARVPAP
ncbi:glycosyltransferase family 39 protein [bacterium]|nr:glycosyltransferase family 39 protein [bacterium]